MSKIARRARKINRNMQNCLVVGNIIDNLPEFSSYFNTIFVLKTEDITYRGRNIVLKEKFEELSIIPTIDFVFFEKNSLILLDKVENLLNFFRPSIYINCGEFIGKETFSKISKLGFENTEMIKNYQIWKSKR
jgi:hypothetical protein